MIPEFPDFVDVSTDIKEDIESYTHNSELYSDFNFVSLYVWDTEKKRKVAKLDGGLAVIMTDYDSGEPRMSFLGELKDISTLEKLVMYAKQSGMPAKRWTWSTRSG